MGTIVLWALLTGGITGGVWVSIVLLGNHAALRREQHKLGTDIEASRAELARLHARLAEMEARHALVQEGLAAQRLPAAREAQQAGD